MVGQALQASRHSTCLYDLGLLTYARTITKRCWIDVRISSLGENKTSQLEISIVFAGITILIEDLDNIGMMTRTGTSSTFLNIIL
jgi:hypothetical protein